MRYWSRLHLPADGLIIMATYADGRTQTDSPRIPIVAGEYDHERWCATAGRVWTRGVC